MYKGIYEQSVLRPQRIARRLEKKRAGNLLMCFMKTTNSKVSLTIILKGVLTFQSHIMMYYITLMSAEM